MNVRDATPGDEPWLIETLDRLDSYDPGFRWYHYVVVTTDDGDRVGLGRITEHDDETVVLSRIRGLRERATAARAHAARGLVKRAIEDDFDTILVAADTTQPFEAVGFREADSAGPVDPAGDETPMRWVPSAEREEETDGAAETDEKGTDRDERDEDEAATAERQSAGEADGGVEGSAAEANDDPSTAKQADKSTAEATNDGAKEPTYKYDPDAAQPTTGATTAADDSGSKDTTPEADDSTAAAARRQGFDPDRVETKYDTEDKTRSATTKYDTDERGETRSTSTKYDTDERGEAQSGETDDEKSATSSDEAETKYDTDESEDSPNTKYSV